MFVWLGIDVSDELNMVKKDLERVEKLFHFESLELPLHISLKISFEIDESLYEPLSLDVINYFSSLKPFDIEIKGIENEKNIVWIRMVNNEIIDNIHRDLNELLEKKYNIPLHEYDKDYIFHATLFMDEDIEKNIKAYEIIKDVKLPKKIRLNKFLIGSSDDGSFNSYHINQVLIV